MYDIVNTTHNVITNRNGINPKYNNRLFTIISMYGQLSVVTGSIKSNINLTYSSDYKGIIWNDLIKPSRMVVNYSYFRGPNVCTNPSDTTYSNECIPDTYQDAYIEFSNNMINILPYGTYISYSTADNFVSPEPTIFNTRLYGEGRYAHDNLRILPLSFEIHTNNDTILDIRHPYLIISLYE